MHGAKALNQRWVPATPSFEDGWPILANKNRALQKAIHTEPWSSLAESSLKGLLAQTLVRVPLLCLLDQWSRQWTPHDIPSQLTAVL